MPLLRALNNVAVKKSSDLLRLVRKDSTYAVPIFSFGNPNGANVASISINPSSKEFTEGVNEALPHGKQRFESPWMADGPFDLKSLTQIQADGNDYFKRTGIDRKPTFYRSWFGVMERLLNSAPTRHSYLDGSACHLDLSPWASDPVWGFLSTEERDEHLRIGLPVLLHQLGFTNGVDKPRTSTIRKILLNGRTAKEEVFKALGVQPTDTSSHTEMLVSATSKTPLKIDQGKIHGIDFVAWNIPLARAFGVQAIPHIAACI